MHLAAFGLKSILLSSPGQVLSFADVRIQLCCREGREGKLWLRTGGGGGGVAKPHRLGGKLEASAYIWDLLHLPPAPALAASIPWAGCSVQAAYTL